jgi:DNA topoisomerase IA
MGYGLEEKNAVVLCKKCNNKKSNRLPQYFYKEKELYELWEKYGIVTDYNIMSINKENIEKEYEKMNKIYSGEVRVTFDYMGKKVEGLLLGIVSPNEVEFNRKREKYLEVVEGNEVNLYKMVNVKRLYIKGEKENARL